MQSKSKDLIKKEYGKKFNDHLLEQYKLFVDSSEKISMKRMSNNNYYLTVNSALFTIAGYFSYVQKDMLALPLSIISIFICLCWISNIASYKKLNSAKFKVIHEIEEHLPAALFKKEDEHLNGYYTLASLKKFIPVFFILVYLSVITINLLSYFNYL